jgi:hypothetical protein
MLRLLLSATADNDFRLPKLNSNGWQTRHVWFGSFSTNTVSVRDIGFSPGTGDQDRESLRLHTAVNSAELGDDFGKGVEPLAWDLRPPQHPPRGSVTAANASPSQRIVPPK